MTCDADVIVIGAGLAGLAAAAELTDAWSSRSSGGFAPPPGQAPP